MAPLACVDSGLTNGFRSDVCNKQIKSRVQSLFGGVAALHRHEVSPFTPTRNEHRHAPLIGEILFTEQFHHSALFLAREQRIGQHNKRKECDRENGRPMNDSLSKKSDKKAQILRVPQERVDAISDQRDCQDFRVWTGG